MLRRRGLRVPHGLPHGRRRCRELFGGERVQRLARRRLPHHDELRRRSLRVAVPEVAVNRALVLLLAAAVMCGCTPSDIPSCPVSSFQNLADHIATKIPLNSQSDCSGYSRASNTESVTDAAPVCSADPSDGACVACLRVACCAVVEQACQADGGALDAATCAADPGVRSCILTALADPCAGTCGGAS
jgi:hypothetical protein